MARLTTHEIDHLNGMLYTSRMRQEVRPIPSPNTGEPATPGTTQPMNRQMPENCRDNEPERTRPQQLRT
jgi:hypothetical protein